MQTLDCLFGQQTDGALLTCSRQLYLEVERGLLDGLWSDGEHAPLVEGRAREFLSDHLRQLLVLSPAISYQH
jgi:hypothetical protein